jgi:hypothetical protein
MELDSCNDPQPSEIDVAKKDQKINPTQKKGRNSFIGDPKTLPKTKPSAPTITAKLIVSQKGPTLERR